MRYFFCGSFMFLFCLVFVMSLCGLFNCALWSPAGKGLTSWLSFVVSNCEFVTFPLVSWVGCGTWLYQFLIFAPLLTFGLLHIIFHTFVPELWSLIYTKISFPLNVSRTKERILPNFIYAFILTRSTMGLLHIVFLHWDCYTSFFAYYYQNNGPWFTSKFCFSSSSWEQIDRISPNFIYAFIFNLTRSTLGLLYIIFCTFVPELLPLIYAKISFLFNILRTTGQILYMHSNWQDLRLDCYTSFFCTVVLELWPLVYAKILFPFNILRTIV